MHRLFLSFRFTLSYPVIFKQGFFRGLRGVYVNVLWQLISLKRLSQVRIVMVSEMCDKIHLRGTSS